MNTKVNTTTAPQATTAAQENIINKIIKTADVHTFFDGCLGIHHGGVNVYYTLPGGRACYCADGCDVALVESESDEAAVAALEANEDLDQSLAADAAKLIDEAVEDGLREKDENYALISSSEETLLSLIEDAVTEAIEKHRDMPASDWVINLDDGEISVIPSVCARHGYVLARAADLDTGDGTPEEIAACGGDKTIFGQDWLNQFDEIRAKIRQRAMVWH